MRKYDSKFVLRRLLTRLTSAVCPFPGKYPLRFLFSDGNTVLYNGKFHAAIWRHFHNRAIPITRDARGRIVPNENPQFWIVYDKAGMILSGNAMTLFRTATPPIVYRYFGSTFVNGPALETCELCSAGPYKFYGTDAILPVSTEWQRRYSQYVNSNIPHIRTV
jgi:hypothetical protein